MNAVTGNIPCPFSRSQHNLCPLQFREGGEKLVLTHRCLRSLHVASPTFRPMCWKQRIPADPEFCQGLLKRLAQVRLVGVSQSAFCSRASLSCTRPQPWARTTFCRGSCPWPWHVEGRRVTWRTCSVAHRWCHLGWKPLRAETWLSV